ncbi:carboxypeptidase-like regulatory domain-containing protein [Kordia sp. TARA_039_SRF]|nr:carboxypeptidase-like regulatory domain-containing protein [Kordia sp. TARA_039_SRF]
MKKSVLIFIVLLTSFAAVAQQRISGIVMDKTSKASLPFANISISKTKGTITDAEGKFNITLNDDVTSIKISYIGYKTAVIPISENTNYLKVQLEPSQEALDAVVLYNKENPALQIMRDAIDRKKQNDPERKLNSFKLTAYNKLLVTANPDSINGQIDSVYTKKDGKLIFKEVDSTNYSFKKDITRSHIYMTEKVSEISFTDSKGKREKILATRMAGFKEPIYELLGIKIQSFSFYNNKYELFGTSYAGPMARNALSKYKYKILDTVSNNNRESYMIYYSPKKKGETSGLEGILYIDRESYALQKGIAEIKGVIDIKAVQNFDYNETFQVWFPTNKEIQIRKGKTDEPVTIFGTSVRVSRSTPQDSIKTVNTNKQDVSDFVYLISKTKNFDLSLNKPVTIRGRGLEIEIEDQAHNRDEAYWNQFRTDSITKRGKETYFVLDSIVEEEDVEKNIYLARKLIRGYYPTKYVDLDLRYLIKYNNYEAFRLGLGGVTNANFSTKYRLNAYGVYGTRDQDFKFGVGAAARLDKRTQTWFGLSYTDDLVETGSSRFITDRRAFSLFEPRLFNIDLFYETRRLTGNIEHQITAKTHANLMLSKSNIESTYDYGFVNNGEIFNSYEITEATFSVQWNPFSEYMQTRHGRSEIKRGFPQFAFQATQSFDGFLGGDFNYTKFDARIVHEIRPIDKGVTSFLLKGGLGIGDIPISHLYHTSPNNPNKDVLLQRFSIAGRNSFETMYFNEFFSDKYAMFQVKHQFKPFKIGKSFRPELMLISRFAIGDADNIERHLGQQFNSLQHGFSESGFEINQLFAGFGLSFMYRYGAYHLPKFEDNLSFKFTYYFSLGF